MPKIKLTKHSVEKLVAPHPSGKQVIFWDAELKGFGVIVSGVTNSKTYIVQRRLPNGRERRITIEATNGIEVDKAREEAKDQLHDLRKGKDPKAERRAHTTLRQALDDYLDARKTLRETSRDGYRSTVERYLSSWLDMPLADVTPDMVEARHRDIKAEVTARHRKPKPSATVKIKGEATANSAMRALRALYNFAAERAPMPPNPVARLKRQWFSMPRREGYVNADALPSWYNAVDELPSATHRDYLKLLLFTGLRRSEAASLRWDNVDFAQKLIRLPAARTKTGKKLDLPMTDFVFDMLVARRAMGKEDFVFASSSASGHLEEPKFPLDQVAEMCGVRVSSHDLRRTFITVAESTDISPLALKALVNHALGGDVTTGYVMMTTERLREPAQRVCDRMKALCNATPLAGENIRRLRI